MPPVYLRSRVRDMIEAQRVVVFSKTSCPYCHKVKELFDSLCVEYNALELDQCEDGTTIQEILMEMTGQNTVPNVFINKEHVGGCDKTLQAHRNGSLEKLLNEDQEVYDYDLIVIGGGSGGLACSMKASELGKKVLLLDFVVPTPQGVSWGLGGTCVNVGCIPKKLMHQAALLGQALRDSRKFGWEYDEQVKHNWQTMTREIQKYIKSRNRSASYSLLQEYVTYENAYAEFVEPHKIRATGSNKKEKFFTADKFVVSTGERPRYLGIPGDKEYCITTDDLFSLPYCPGKTLVVGASYLALECAGFLDGIGVDVTVMVPSILLHGFDQEMAERARSYMEEHGVKFIRKFVPTAIERLEEGAPGKIKVVAKSTEGPDVIEGEYNTVLIAVGRDACTRNIGLDKIGVEINEKNGKVPVNDEEQTNVPYVYAIGDILDGQLELTPVAIQAGKLLARRLFDGSTKKCDYINVPTTVFTPIEYGCCGYSEERANEQFGEENLEVFYTSFTPLEWRVFGRDYNACYAKIICDKRDDDRVVGFHVLGQNAGEVTQGFGVAMKCGLNKQLLDETFGIHPPNAEVFTTMEVTKNSGADIAQ